MFTNQVIMVRPASFGSNPETAGDNVFQNKNETNEDICTQALIEFDRMVGQLRENGVQVDVWQDSPLPVKPDAVFPNNWLSTHEDGTAITYPMMAPTRRDERVEALIGFLDGKYGVHKRYDFHVFEDQGLFLEGTGSMILDRKAKIVYAALSSRTSMELVHRFALLMGYDMVTFKTAMNGIPVYHTNVLMTIGHNFCLLCDEIILELQDKSKVLSTLEHSGLDVIKLSIEQVRNFAGNALQLKLEDGTHLLVISERAWLSLTRGQQKRIEKHTEVLKISIPTIEKFGGGSVRCMLAENFL